MVVQLEVEVAIFFAADHVAKRTEDFPNLLLNGCVSRRVIHMENGFYLRICFRISRAALCPDAPVTPFPGCAPLLQTKSPLTGVA